MTINYMGNIIDIKWEIDDGNKYSVIPSDQFK